jgi:hypothetical protein
MRLIGKVGEFELFESKPVSADGWQSLRLIRTGNGKFRKRSWWLGWNGERLAENRDAKILEEHYPEIYVAVIEAVQ